MQKIKLRVLLPFLLAPLFIYADDVVAEEKVSDEVALVDDSTFSPKTASPPEVGPSLKTLDGPYKNPFIAVGLSFVTPGLGSIYLGDYRAGGAILGTTLVGLGTDRSFILPQNAWFYGIYAAYRDVRIYNKASSHYSYPMPTDSFADLAKAPFRWRVLKKPEVWGGLIGMLAVSGLISHYAFPDIKIARCETSSEITPLAAFPVGIGEEAFFRGYLQPLLSEPFTPIGGIIVSSIAFGAVHFGNAEELKPEERWRYYTYIIPYITAIGGYFGWLTYKNNSLQQSVALHSWYDFIVFSAASFAPDAALSRKAKFAISFSF